MKALKLTAAIQAALLVGSISMVSGAALAQDQNSDEQTTEESQTLERIEVVGSRLKRAEVEGALPVTVIDRATIDASGKVSVADVLRDTTFASFGNFRPQSGSSAQALADIDLRGLGSSRTLVLIDGRRAPKAPFAAGSQDLNAIPTAAVERIEILSDGASAVYGSDAIGGVVNIVLRRDFQGAEVRMGYGRTAVEGGDTHEYSAIFGQSSDRGNMIISASANDRGMVFTRDQIGYVQGVSTYGNNFRNVLWDVVRDADGNPIRDMNGNLQPLSSDEGALAFMTSPKAIPGFACNSDGFWMTGAGTCSFDFNSVAANEASIKNKGLFARGTYDINENWSTYMTATAQKVNSFGRYAPVPALAIVAPGTPNDMGNGTIREYTAADGTVYAIGTALYHRLAAAGNRDTTSDSTATDFLLGFQGNLGSSLSLDFGLRRSNYRYNEFGSGYTVNPLLVAALESGAYNALDPFSNSPEVLAAIQATINRRSISTVDELFATANFDLFEMSGGISNMVIGAEYRQEEYADLYDSLSEAGVIDGSAGNSAQGDRSVRSMFTEWLLPFTSTFEATLAGRFDKYNDYGSDFSPKLGLRWHPVDNFTLRGSYGTGFRAPSLDILTQKTSFSADSVYDPQTCKIFGGNPAACDAGTVSVQVDTYYRANPDMASEQSKQFALGFAYDPISWLNFTLDYYNIEIENRIRQFSAQALIDRTNNPALGPIPAGLGVVRNADGSILRIDAGYGNEGTLETDGFDFNARTNFELGSGTLNNQLQVGYVRSYTVDDGDNMSGYVGAPKYRANLSNTYNIGSWTIGAISRYIDGQMDPGETEGVGGYTTHDLYVNWKAPWNTEITLGANNVGDRYPQLYGYDGRPWNFYLYDAYGRTVYARLVQRF